MIGDDLIGTGNECPVCKGTGYELCRTCMGAGEWEIHSITLKYTQIHSNYSSINQWAIGPRVRARAHTHTRVCTPTP